jgi:hypothetical protein
MPLYSRAAAKRSSRKLGFRHDWGLAAPERGSAQAHEGFFNRLVCSRKSALRTIPLVSRWVYHEYQVARGGPGEE